MSRGKSQPQIDFSDDRHNFHTELCLSLDADITSSSRVSQLRLKSFHLLSSFKQSTTLYSHLVLAATTYTDHCLL
jgi:hypothetical protein